MNVCICVGPPSFSRAIRLNISVSVGQNVQVSVPVRSHTVNITACLINKLRTTTEDNNEYSTTTHTCVIKLLPKTLTSHSKTDNQHEKCICSLNGTVPDLMLNVHIYHVTVYESGRWQLTIANKEGKDTQNIGFSVVPSKAITV